MFHLNSGPVTGAGQTGPVQAIPGQSSSFQMEPMGSAQKAMLHASNVSYGFFVTTDSTHGNLILPVLPRFT